MDERRILEEELVALQRKITAEQQMGRTWRAEIRRSLVDDFGAHFLAAFDEDFLRRNFEQFRRLSTASSEAIKTSRVIVEARIRNTAGQFLDRRIQWFDLFTHSDFQRAFQSYLNGAAPETARITERYTRYILLSLINAINTWLQQYSACYTLRGLRVERTEFVRLGTGDETPIVSLVDQRDFSDWVHSLNTTLQSFLVHFEQYLAVEIEYREKFNLLAQERLLAKWRREGR